MKKFIPLFALLSLALASCAGVPQKSADDATPLVLKPASFSSLKGWGEDSMDGFMEAYLKSCARILKKDAAALFSSNVVFGTYGDWQPACKEAMMISARSPQSTRAFMERHFKVMQASAAGDTQGLFTGYYESTLQGSRTRGGAYQHPLLGRPDDLVMVDLGEFREELKGQRIAGRVLGGKLKPYENRAAIVTGKLSPENFKPIVWLNSKEDAFFVQVQGSGIVHLAEGGIMRVGYAGQNGHPYNAIGRELVKRGIYKKEDVSMESIRTWMLQNPDKADDLMNTNPSYVFFEEKKDDGTGQQDGAVGAEGITLTPQRSLAVDSSKIPYGLPVYLDIAYNDSAKTPIRRLVMAQDTGGAIRGAVRGDFFWGSGAEAEKMAGPMKARGGYYFLVPKNL